MGITFHTENLNKQLYKLMIWNIVTNYGRDVYDYLTFWDIHIHPLKDFKANYFDGYETAKSHKVNFNMAWGMTGKYKIDLYLDDTKGHRYGMMNSTVVQHEIAHSLLFGTSYFVTGVHDNVTKTFPITFWYRDRFWWRRMKVRCIDIRSMLD
jgi:peroxiredoxin family protein